eukprot:g1344.t1
MASEEETGDTKSPSSESKMAKLQNASKEQLVSLLTRQLAKMKKLETANQEYSSKLHELESRGPGEAGGGGGGSNPLEQELKDENESLKAKLASNKSKIGRAHSEEKNGRADGKDKEEDGDVIYTYTTFLEKNGRADGKDKEDGDVPSQRKYIYIYIYTSTTFLEKNDKNGRADGKDKEEDGDVYIYIYTYTTFLEKNEKNGRADGKDKEEDGYIYIYTSTTFLEKNGRADGKDKEEDAIHLIPS